MLQKRKEITVPQLGNKTIMCVHWAARWGSMLDCVSVLLWVGMWVRMSASQSEYEMDLE